MVAAVDGSQLEFLPGALDAFKELCGSSDVYLVTTVSDEAHASTVRELMERAGLHDAGLDRRVSLVLWCLDLPGLLSMRP